tara:strand:+ start:1262 stop:1909 length:648 start_codon:yes stop_codon:yes gene_type:complete
MEIQGKVAIVFGAGTETGRAIALALAAKGASIVAADSDTPRATETIQIMQGSRQALSAGAGSGTFFHCDANKIDSLKHLFNVSDRVFGGIDIVCNQVDTESNIDEWLGKGFKEILDSKSADMNGALGSTQQALHYMKRRGAGIVVNVLSETSNKQNPNDKSIQAFKESCSTPAETDKIQISLVIEAETESAESTAATIVSLIENDNSAGEVILHK